MKETKKELEKLIAQGIFDPGSVVGYKGDRTLTEWQVDAVMENLDNIIIEARNMRFKMFPYADNPEISGMSWNGFYLLGDKKSIDEFKRLKNDADQIAIWRREFNERINHQKTQNDKLETVLQRIKELLG